MISFTGKFLYYQIFLLAAFNNPTFVPSDDVLNDPVFHAATETFCEYHEITNYIYWNTIEANENKKVYYSLKDKYQTLKSCPQLGDLCRLPELTDLNDTYDFQVKVKENFEKQANLHWNKEYYDYVLADLDKRMTLIRTMISIRQMVNYDKYSCRVYLKELRSKMGFPDYYASSWPCPIPQYAFYELEK